RTAFQEHCPTVDIRRVGDSGCPALGTKDPEILKWCEANDYCLLTDNRNSMPTHLADHLLEGRHIPGIFQIDKSVSIGENVWCVAVIVGASIEREHLDQIVRISNLISSHE